MIDLERDLSRYGDFLADTVPAVEPEEARNVAARRVRSLRRPVAVVVAAAIAVLLGIGGVLFALRPEPDRQPTVTEPPAPQTTVAPAPTTVPAPTTAPEPTSAVPDSEPSAPTTLPGEAIPVAAVQAWIQEWLDADFASSDPPEGLTGAMEVRCDDERSLAAGDVLVCEFAYSRTEPGYEFENGALVVYVLDDTGRSAWLGGSDYPSSTERLVSLHESDAAAGLSCSDLVLGDPDAGFFQGAIETPRSAFFKTLVYWALEGAPERMDADGNGVPCESLYPSDVVEGVLAGGAAWPAPAPDPGAGPVAGLVLRGDGLGPVDFGTPTAETLAVLEEALGPPSRTDQGFFSYYYWDELGLSVSFDEYAFYRDDGVEHFVGWGHWADGAQPHAPLVVRGASGLLRTGREIGPGASYDELIMAYGDQVALPVAKDECLSEWYAWLNDPGDSPGSRIHVVFDSDPEAGGRITFMRAGASEGC